MATVTLTPDTITPSIRLLVYYKWVWDYTWTFNPDWQPLSFTKAAAPEIGNALLKLRYGEGFWEDYYDMETGNPLHTYSYCYVQINAQHQDKEYMLWTGIIPTETFDLLGKSDLYRTVDQTVQALGLDMLLETRLDGAWVEPVMGGTPVWLDYLPTFNLRYDYGGNVVGNKSDWNAGKESYIFAETGNTWTNKDIIQYLLKHYQGNNGPQFLLGGTTEILDALDMITGVYNFSSVSLRQALNTLINRGRGFSWKYLVDSDGNVTIEPFSLLDEPIVLGGITMPANNTKISIDLWENMEHTVVKVTQDITHTYDKIIVKGGKMKSCCSLWLNDNSLEKGWTTAEEIIYKDASKNISGYGSLSDEDKKKLNDKYRSIDRFERIYSTFRIPRDWNWKTCRSGSSYRIVNPKLNAAGVLNVFLQAVYWNVNKRILNYLPFFEGVDYGGSVPVVKNPDNSEPEFRKMFALILDNTNKYQYAEKLEPFGATIRPLTREMGVSIKFRPSYIAAYNHWSGAEPGVYNADVADNLLDYETLIITAFIETDQIVQLSYNFNQYENKRVLTIEIADAELWYITPDTIVDVNDAGDYVLYGGNSVIRDDRNRLKAVLAAAVAWYGKRRNKVEISIKNIDLGIPIGTLLTNVDIAEVGVSGSVVTNVTWDLQGKEPETKITTDFQELQLAEIFKRG